MAHLLDTDPYPWPWDGCLDGDRLALVIAGGQAHWLGSSTGVAEARQALGAAARAVAGVGGLVVAVRHGADPAVAGQGRRPHLPTVGTAPWALDLPAGVDLDVVVDAGGLDGFCRSGLDAVLRAHRRDHLVLAGAAAEVVVDSTLRSANDRGYECLVVADACAPIDPGTGAGALASVAMSGGIFGAVGTTAALAAALRAPDHAGPPPPPAPRVAAPATRPATGRPVASTKETS